MNDMSPIAGIGDNNPPSAIDEAVAPFSDVISEAENWLDGEAITTESQMHAVDAVIKDIRKANTEVGKAEKAAVGPLHAAWKDEKARWKPTLDDLSKLKTGLAALVDPFKKKLADQKEAAKRAAYEEAQRLEQEAKAAQEALNPANIDQQREAAQMQRDAMDAKKTAQAASKDAVKGMRTVTKHEIEDMRAAVNWIAKNDKQAMADFAAEYVRKNHKETKIAGVKVWTEKEAY